MLSFALFIASALLTIKAVHGSCELACENLSTTLPPSIFFAGPSAPIHLWSAFQANARPLCRAEPESSAQVAEILAIVRRHECHFAVLGGGTSPFRGASNAHQGVTISLRRMRDVEFVDETTKKEIRVGGGSAWADVYSALDPFNMSATGTRNSLTGVVGSILGGGISFFSERNGWACDTVLSFTLILANSTLVTATPTTYPSLFWALKGGGNNFGIVTSVVITTFREPPTWYSFQLFDINDRDIVFRRLENHTATMPKDVWQIATTLQWHVPTEKFVISERMVASERPELPSTIPRTMQNGSWEESRVLQTNAYQRSTLAMAQKMDGMNEDGYYNFFGTITVRSNAAVSMALADVFMQEVEAIKQEEGLQIYIVYNPLTRNALRQMKQRGGNALGVEEVDGPLTVVNINLHWSVEESEPKMRQFMRRLINRFGEAAESMDMLHPYLFQNHAFEEQDVFAGSGDSKLARLRAVRQEVDPDGVFQRLQPGFFKLGFASEAREEKSEL